MPGQTVMLPLSDINPVLLRSARNVLAPGFVTGRRVIQHYQLQYVHEGHGQIGIAGQCYPVAKGMLCFWGPDTEHEISSDPAHPLIILGAQFHLHSSLKPVRFSDFNGFPACLKIQTQARVESLLTDMAREFANQRKYWRETSNALCKSLLFLLARETGFSQEERHSSWQTAEQILKLIQDRYMESLTNQTIADHFHFHPATVNKLVRKSTGLSLHQYLVNLRINHAVELLNTTSLSVGEIGAAVGYPNIHYFSRLFKKKMGLSPSELR